MTKIPLFDRFYVTMNSCKLGFKSGCRPLIGLDGYHLKFVDLETKDSWKWILEIVLNDIGDCTHHGWEFVIDQQNV